MFYTIVSLVIYTWYSWLYPVIYTWYSWLYPVIYPCFPRLSTLGLGLGYLPCNLPLLFLLSTLGILGYLPLIYPIIYPLILYHLPLDTLPSNSTSLLIYTIIYPIYPQTILNGKSVG